MIRGLVSDGTTVLLTTQYLDEADQLADEIVVIDHGKVIAAGTSKELKMRVGGQVVVAQPVDPGEVPSTRRILEAFARDEDAIHAEGDVVTVSIADGVELGQVARRLDDEGIQMDELALRRPSLDEVFLAITGHAAEDRAELGDEDPGRADERRTA
jgi:oleandomycin transport system ATP-binding protein